MKKGAFILFTSLLAYLPVWAQTAASPTGSANNIVTVGVHIPFGEFSETHFGGIGLGYAWSRHRFGKLDALPGKLIGLTVNAGVDYYFGKKIQTVGYDFKFGGYAYLSIAGGAIYNPRKNGSISLTTGPSLGIYNGNTRAGFRVNLNGSYFVNDKISIIPGIIYMKHSKVNALWAAALSAAYNF